MTADPARSTRRQLLAGLAGVGGISAGAGAFTSARLHDREQFANALGAGTVGIDVECDDPGCRAEDGRLTFDVAGLEPGSSGSVRFAVDVLDNPVRAWLRTECSPAIDPLGDALEVRLSIAGRCDGPEDGRQLFPATPSDWGTLAEFRDAFGGGRRLDESADPCLAAADDHCVRLEYQLSEHASVAPGADSALVADLFAEQCRHVSEAAVEPPFEDVPCPELGCPDCLALGKLEVRGDRLDVQTYDFDELEAPFADDGHQYELEVLDVGEENPGETTCAGFRLLRDGEEAVPMCEVDVKGGPDTRTVAVDPPSSQTQGLLCTAETSAGNSGTARRPAISHLVVSVCADAGGDGGDGGSDKDDSSNGGNDDGNGDSGDGGNDDGDDGNGGESQ